MPPLPGARPGAGASPVAAVVLDVGGVLVVPHHEHLAPALAPFGATADPAAYERAHYAGMHAVDLEGDARAHPGDWTAYQLAYAAAVGVAEAHLAEAVGHLDRALDGQAHLVWSKVLDGAAPGLAALAAAGLPIAVVSNSDGTVEELLAATGLCQVGPGPGVDVAAIVDSGVVGVAKPDPRIFSFALGPLGVAAGRALYVGDSALFDVGGARAAGLQPLHLDPYGLCGADDHPHARSLTEVAARLSG